MTAAIHFHAFYPGIARRMAPAIAEVAGDTLVLVTHVGPVDPALAALLPGAEFVEVPNRGWDIGPLLHLLPLLQARGITAIAHLHTKKGDSGYAAEWRAMGLEGTLGDPGLVARLADAFASDDRLMLAGPAALWKSAATHQFRNAALLDALAPALMAPLYPPADWGFFAGSFFWARTDLLRRLVPLAEFSDEGARDGTLAHALERLIGLAAVALDGRVALVGEDGAIATVVAPGAPSHEPIIRTLVARAERQSGPLDAELAALIAARNPLVDYIRHGRDADALDPNPYFSTSFHNRIHEDVFAAGMHPLHHYIHHGAAEGRATGPLFDGLHYRTAYPDVSGDPLRHFLEIGAAEGRVAINVTPTREDDGPTRFYRHFDAAAEAAFLRDIAGRPGDEADTLVSIIMPAWNRQDTIAAAIRSVLAQTHHTLELIVVDDGSTDATRDIVRELAADPRVILVEGAHRGVSAARNLGLSRARGAVIAYLDSDNRWTGWFLEVMLRTLEAEGAEAGYSAIALRDDLGQLTGYRGAPFDWEACLDQNYVDLNAFVHRRALLDTVGDFDTKLRRMVDWDLILRVGKDRRVAYAPFVGCDYSDRKGDAARITTTEPSAFQKVIAARHRGVPLRLAFAIKIAAPEDGREAWGDWHFADALAASLRRLGHDARVDCRERWSGHASTDEDVVIVLRGLIRYAPRPGQLAYLWNISHPDQVDFAEMDAFTGVYAASPSHTALLGHVVRPPVELLWQATDPSRFAPVVAPAGQPDYLFVGNTRGADRPIVDWARAAGLAVEIHGEGWLDAASRNYANADLGASYANAAQVLNDHWPSMAAFGIVSNRLFDIAAAAGRALSDPVPGIADLFGDAVAQVSSPSSLAAARPVRDVALAGRVAAKHSFDARASRLLAAALSDLGMTPRPPAAPRTGIPVHAIVPHGPHGPQSSAYIRLVAPLTDPSITGRIALTLGRAEDPVPPCAVCIVQRTALSTTAAVDTLVRHLGEISAALVTDVDDGFAALGPDHPEAAIYRPLNAALERAVAASAETWFSCEGVAALYGAVAGRRAIVPNAIDPRLWRDWRNPRPRPATDGPLRLLYMGTHTHAADFARLRPALDRLWAERPGAFRLTLVGVMPDAPPAEWLDRLAPPAEAIPYPRFVRWLRQSGHWDAGLAPLADTAFNRAKSDIKLLDYAALGLLPVVEDCPAYRADTRWNDVAFHAADWDASLRWVLDNRAAAVDRAEAAHDLLWRTRVTAGIAPTLADRIAALVA